jgi:hypothetical protein
MRNKKSIKKNMVCGVVQPHGGREASFFHGRAQREENSTVQELHGGAHLSPGVLEVLV